MFDEFMHNNAIYSTNTEQMEERRQLGANATKVWITGRGRCVVANNKEHIPEKELSYLL